MGRALATVVTCAAQTLHVPRARVVQAVGLTLLDAPSLKAALDIDWQDPAAQAEALARLLSEVDRLEAWVVAQEALAAAPTVQGALTTLRQVLTQDLEPDPTSGQRRIRRGVPPTACRRSATRPCDTGEKPKSAPSRASNATS